MNADEDRVEDGGFWQWWPCGLGGLCWPFVRDVLAGWFALPVASGVAMTLTWLAVGLIFIRRPPNPVWTYWRWAAGGVMGGVVSGLVTLAFQGR